MRWGNLSKKTSCGLKTPTMKGLSFGTKGGAVTHPQEFENNIIAGSVISGYKLPP